MVSHHLQLYTLSEDDYKKLFQVILTDDGHEFYYVENIEYNHKTGEYTTHLFFCDSSASWQKGGIEKNHEFIRYVLPKKTTFKNLTQNDCNIISNHINSLCRESLIIIVHLKLCYFCVMNKFLIL